MVVKKMEMTPSSLLSDITKRNLGRDRHQEVTRKLWIKFGRACRDLRRRRKIRLSVFAKWMSRTPAMISFMENGRRQWPLDRAKLAVKLLRHPMWPNCPVNPPVARRKKR